jgi:hypothetical protein
MSHISLYEAHERRDLGFATPHPRERGRTVKDFVQATPPTRNFISVATPCSRRIVLGTDLVAEIEEEEHSGELQGNCNMPLDNGKLNSKISATFLNS